VRDAVVTRVLPDGLRVRVTEREARVISRTGGGRLVWVDDEGVVLGAAAPGEEDFFIRGIEEGRTPEAAKQNRVRVNAARELAREWAQAGLTKRVSELNLEDLDDVRVQLAGPDAAVEVRLGREDFPKRFRQALEVLDAQRLTPRGPYISYIDVSQGKRAVVGTGATAHYRPEPEAESPEPQSPDAVTQSAPAPEPARTAPARTTPARTTPAPGAKKKAEARPTPKAEERKANAQRPTGAATRPRRVG
jgi:cell division septal protein FtsQ